MHEINLNRIHYYSQSFVCIFRLYSVHSLDVALASSAEHDQHTVAQVFCWAFRE